VNGTNEGVGLEDCSSVVVNGDLRDLHGKFGGVFGGGVSVGCVCEEGVPRVKKVCIEMLIRKAFGSFNGFHLSINNYSVLDLTKTLAG